MNLIISGLSGSGKTTLSKYLSKKLNLCYVSGSENRLAHSEIKNLTPGVSFWRISNTAKILDKKRLNNPESDLAADEKLRQLCISNDNIVFDVWPLPWMECGDSKKIWLESPLDIRANRIFKTLSTDRQNYDEIRQKILQKDERARQFFLKFYNFDIFVDRKPFDLIINTSYFDINKHYTNTIEETIAHISDIIIGFVNYWKGDWQKGKNKINFYLNKFPNDLILRLPIGYKRKGIN